MNKWWKWFIPGYIWLLPFTLGYAVFAFIFYRARSWGFRNGVLIGVADKPMIGRPGAQTIGATTIFKDTTVIGRLELHAHENTHIVEAFVAGLCGQVVGLALIGTAPWQWVVASGFIGAAAYSLLYIAVFLSFYFTTQKDEIPGWEDDYRRNFLEQAAFKAEDEYWRASPEERTTMWD